MATVAQPATLSLQAKGLRRSTFSGAGIKAAAPRAAAISSGRKAMLVVRSAMIAEYIWSDNQEGQPQKGMIFNQMRSKSKVLQKNIAVGGQFPDWSYDGSSTGQAKGNNSDCILRPVASYPDPIRGGDNVLVMCEVYGPDGNPHPSNTRAKLRGVLTKEVVASAPLYGFEQEFTMLGADGRPYGWPEGGFPAPQGPYYCGVGLESVYGRPLAEAHMEACMKAGLIISGINAEVMPSQWEFQIGPVGPLEVGDQTYVARWLLHRLGEEHGITVTYDPKPVLGDWNGTGGHTNFSTEPMRKPGGMVAIDAAIERLSKKHPEHISQYGIGNEARLTGHHETCDINTFRSGAADRGASIRIPLPVQLAGYGYLEDRRPAANCDPYVVARLLLQTTFDLGGQTA